MTSVLGVDGGQSGIRLRHSSGGRVVEVAGVSRLEGDEVVDVADAIARGWREGAFEPVERVVLGLTTAPIDRATCDRLCGLVGAATGAPEVWLADDAVTAHAGALSLGWGVSIVGGTGVACLAVPSAGAPKIIGGHGFLLGDEGGAYWVGREGIRAALRSTEGRGAATSLADAISRRYGAVADLPVRLHGTERPVQMIAQFAPDVASEACAGDVVARAIIDEAARELWLVIRAGAAWAAMDGAEPVPLAVGGRLLEPGGEVRRALDELIAREPLGVVARSADAVPLEGAVNLGLSGDPASYGDLIHRWSTGARA